MNINQIKYFVSTFELGSFSAAARHQYVTVQAMSKSIADLERELDETLFVRKNRSVHPTEFGERFYLKALPALRAFEELEGFSQDQDEHPCNNQPLHILLCTPPFPGHQQFIDRLSRILSRYLATTVHMSLSLISEGLDHLTEKRADAIVTIGTLEQPLIACNTLGTIEAGVVMAPNHPLAAASAVRIDDMNAYPVLLSNEFDNINDSILSVYRRESLHSSLVSVDSEGFDFDTFLTEQNGLAFCAGIPALTRSTPNMIMKPIDPLDAKPIPICLNTLKKRNDAAVKVLLRLVKDPLDPLSAIRLR